MYCSSFLDTGSLQSIYLSQTKIYAIADLGLQF